MNDYLIIIKHFGIKNQLKKLNEECYEVIEAVQEHNEWENKATKEHLIEELADIEVLLTQIREYYGITQASVDLVKIAKVNRTLERIETNYYK